MMFHQTWIALLSGMNVWHQGALFVERLIGFGHEPMLIVAAIMAWIGAGLVLRRPLTALLPWLCVLVVVAWTEAVETVITRWPRHAPHYGETAKGLLLAMLVPTMLMFAARLRPQLFQGRGGKRRR